MGLIKLAVYGLIGYAIYEVVRNMESSGMLQNAMSGGQQRGGGQQEGQLFTGGGRGQSVEVADDSGITRHENVGRGVIR